MPGESWRTLLQTFRTKIFLALSDDFSPRTASDLCGKEEQLKANYTLSGMGQNARVSVSMLTGKAVAHRATLAATGGYTAQRDVPTWLRLRRARHGRGHLNPELPARLPTRA